MHCGFFGVQTDTLQVPGLCEGAEAAVEGFFDIVREAAAGQFFYGQMTP